MTEQSQLSGEWNGGRFFRFSLLWLALSAMWTALMSIVLPEMADHFATQSSSYGRGELLAVIMGTGAAVSAITQVVVGWFSDRSSSPWRRWKFMMLGLPLTAFPLYLLGASTSVLQVVVAMVLLQLTANTATGPYQALIPDAVPLEKHGAASTWMGLFSHGGQILGPVLAAKFLGDRLVGLENLEAVLFGGLMMGLLCLWTALPPSSQQQVPEVHSMGLGKSLKAMLGSERNFLLLIQSRLIINVGFYLVVSFLLYYIRYSLGYEQTRQQALTQLMGSMVVAGLVGGLVIGPLADRRAKKPLLYMSCAITGLGMLGFMATPAGNLILATIFALIAGFGFGGFSVVDWSLACNLAPKSTSALSMGVWNLAAVLAQIIAPGIFGPLSDALIPTLGEASTYRLIMGAVVLFLLIGCLRLRPLEERPK